MTEDEFDEALRALAHGERRRLLLACQGGWRAAGTLADGTTLSLATVSEHLKVLRKTGLVVLKRDGRFWLYRTDQVLLGRIIDRLNQVNKER